MKIKLEISLNSLPSLLCINLYCSVYIIMSLFHSSNSWFLLESVIFEQVGICVESLHLDKFVAADSLHISPLELLLQQLWDDSLCHVLMHANQVGLQCLRVDLVLERGLVLLVKLLFVKLHFIPGEEFSIRSIVHFT